MIPCSRCIAHALRNHVDIVVFLWLQLPVFQGAVALHALDAALWRSWRFPRQGPRLFFVSSAASTAEAVAVCTCLPARHTAWRACSR